MATVKDNLLRLQADYYRRQEVSLGKAQNIFPLHDKERELRVQYIDDARICKMIYKILTIGDVDKIFKTIEYHLANTKVYKFRQELKSLQSKLAKNLISEEDQIGITELSDPSLNNSWIDRLRAKANIIITKNLQPIIEPIVQNKHRIIVHVTCTGLGGTPFEPGVPPAPLQIKATEELIKRGFPVEQIVLRMDPVILFNEGIKAQELVLRYFGELGVTRCRYSFLDQYPNTKENLERLGIKPVSGFTYPKPQIQQYSAHLTEHWGSQFHLESCCEETSHRQACISQMDLDILMKNAVKNRADFTGLANLQLVGCKSSRRLCSCPLNKFELMRSTPGCAYDCAYCYWKR